MKTGTAGQDLPEGTPKRKEAAHVYNTNVTSVALLTDKLAPLLERSKNPKVINLSSFVGSIERCAQYQEQPPSFFQYYASSKAALNFLTVYYAKKYPKFKVNAVDPGKRATAMNGAELNEETDPKLGAVRVAELVKEGPDGISGTYSNNEGPLPW
jgi:NAD(P)-dependent dehydrogenase (short-subunit alcohol dehydrogenase family)